MRPEDHFSRSVGVEPYQVLVEELHEWRLRNMKPRLWLRDDDACEPSANLDKLLSIAESYDIPLILAVIPRPTGSALAVRLEDVESVRIATHGWSHDNHAPENEQMAELGAHRAIQVVIEELKQGANKLRTLYGSKMSQMLVPPWNTIDARLLSHLPSIGFGSVSVIGRNLRDETTPELLVANVDIDIMDWENWRCHDEYRLANELVQALKRAREVDDEPIGVLSHHQVHDETAWRFLVRLFATTRECSWCSWIDYDELITAAMAKSERLRLRHTS